MVCFPIREDIGTVLSALSYEGLARRSIFLALPIYQNWSSFKTHRTFFQTCSSRLLYFSKYPETQLLPKLDSNRERTARRCLSFWSCVLLKIERLLFSASTCLLNLLYGIAIYFHLGIEVSISVLILILDSRNSSLSLSSLEDPSLSVKASVERFWGRARLFADAKVHLGELKTRGFIVPLFKISFSILPTGTISLLGESTFESCPCIPIVPVFRPSFVRCCLGSILCSFVQIDF